MDRLYPQVWMALDKDIKDVLVKEFKIERGGQVEILNQEIVKDGYRTEDLAVINVENMMAFVEQDKELSFSRMWELTIAKINFILHPPIIAKEEDVLPPLPPKIAPWCYYCEAKAFAHRPECTRPNKPVETFTKTESTEEIKVDEGTEIITGEIKEEINEQENKQNKGSVKSGNTR